MASSKEIAPFQRYAQSKKYRPLKFYLRTFASFVYPTSILTYIQDMGFAYIDLAKRPSSYFSCFYTINILLDHRYAADYPYQLIYGARLIQYKNYQR